MMKQFLAVGSSVLFVLTGLSSIFFGWGISQSFEQIYRSFPYTISPPAPPFLALSYGVFAILGLLAFHYQTNLQKHWLGWIGVICTFVGLLADTALAFSLKLPGAGFSLSTGDVHYVGPFYAFSLLSIGLVFWALDLPTNSHVLLLQKATMAALAFLPFCELLVLFFSFTLRAGPIFHTWGIINGVLWIVLGVSVWWSTSTRTSPNAIGISPSPSEQ